jgi:hypothetical protein
MNNKAEKKLIKQYWDKYKDDFYILLTEFSYDMFKLSCKVTIDIVKDYLKSKDNNDNNTTI